MSRRPLSTMQFRGSNGTVDGEEDMLEKLLIPAGIFLLSAALLTALRAIAFRLLARWAERTTTKADDIIVSSLRGPSLFWAIALALALAVQFSEIPRTTLDSINKIVYVILIFSVTLAAANLSGRIFKSFIQQSNLPLPTTGLAYGLVKGIIMLLGLLMILGVLGVSIAPLITALGIGGLAVALALQDTLANLFAGIHILLEKSVRVGDFVRLETGQEGYVDDITWRTTRVRMLPNNVVVIPNSKLAQSVVTNYYLPDRRMASSVAVGVSYSADPDRVERILTEEAKKAVGQVPGLLADPEPAARFSPGFSDSSLDFTIGCHVREFVDQYQVQHELRKRIFKRLREEGIEIPYPHRTVHILDDRERKA
jgi:small-conductance mechanosensitive channel